MEAKYLFAFLQKKDELMEGDAQKENQNDYSEEVKYVMLIDDEPTKPAIESLYNDLTREGYKVDVIKDPGEVEKLSDEQIYKYPVFIIDYNMVNMYGDELIPVIRERNLFAYIIVYTGFPNVDKYETLKKINLIGADFWAAKGDQETESEMFVRLDYAFRRVENIFSPLHLNLNKI